MRCRDMPIQSSVRRLVNDRTDGKQAAVIAGLLYESSNQ